MSLHCPLSTILTLSTEKMSPDKRSSEIKDCLGGGFVNHRLTELCLNKQTNESTCQLSALN